MNFSEYYKARDFLEELLKKDLIGPVKEDEIIEDSLPEQYYVSGILFPQGEKLDQFETGENLADDQEDNDNPINMCYSINPSSMGLSLTVKPGVDLLLVKIGFAWYCPEEASPEKGKRKKKVNWHRKSQRMEKSIDLSQRKQIKNLHRGLELRVFLQREYKDGSKTFTLSLVNTNPKQMDIERNNTLTFFQPEIFVSASNENEDVFIEKKPRVEFMKDEEVLNLEMLYRHNKTFAIGHGCSVNWEAKGEFANVIYTEFLPKHELYQLKPATHVERKVLNFKFLSEAPKEEILKSLKLIENSYQKWIIKKREEASKIPENYIEIANKNLSKCENSLKRIKKGIEALYKDDVFKAFKLINKAMLLSRLKRDGKPEEEGWFPFQLAFILQEIPSIENHEDLDRNTVDLLWFPTGGGKTEAYLGLAAFAIFLRRIRSCREGNSGAGVTVLMRYTLRLLTLQQFERASALICACELIRKENEKFLGFEEISAGLWVGGGLTPNWRKEAKKALETIRKQGNDFLGEEEANPCQLQACPWCSSKIKEQNYRVENNKMVITCSNEECEFFRGLPVFLVDEDIYDLKPSLVIGTVDKFARMTWEKRVGDLFGLNSELKPPELIIQDELHLISGPLGTICGLYEVAVDQLCQKNKIVPKIIASTATIRNAENQILNLYGREFFQFPAQGIDIRDSYFAEEADRMEKPTRNYLGVISPGKSGNTLMIRVYSVLLFATRYLRNLGYSEELIDSFWTLTGYFNSLRQLGGAVNNLIDDVYGRLKFLKQTKFNEEFPADEELWDYPEFDELTSRKGNNEISKVLKRLENSYPDQSAYDVILASNMLSVGIDIGRLGLMVLQGQPKLNAEYIQATSRVGRATPGLVITMADASRSRDRSHYEQFRSFHSSLYRFVEATSITPFSERSRDKALHAILISLARHQIDGLRENDQASRIIDFRKEVELLIETILSKVEKIDKSELQSTKEHLQLILDHWEQMSENSVGGLIYEKKGSNKGVPLLTKRYNLESYSLPTLNSMRNVDEECDVFLLEGN